MYQLFTRICWLLALTLGVHTTAFAKGRVLLPVRAPITMSDYIDLNCKASCAEQEELLESTNEAAQANEVDQRLLLAIVRVESSFKVRARNGSNAGLMQVHTRWHRKKLVGQDPYAVKLNIAVGAAIYRGCLDKHGGNTTKALKCYNGAADPRYVDKIRKAQREIDALLLFNSKSFIGSSPSESEK